MELYRKLLELACRRIHELDQPACLKSSELHYIEVNAAYARVFGYPETAFAGHDSGEFDSAYEGSERQEAERRCVVFGEDSEIIIEPTQRGERYQVFTEQFVTDDSSVFLFQFFEPCEEASRVSANDEGAEPQSSSPHVPERILEILNGAISAIDVVIFVVSPEGYIVYFNDKFREMYSELGSDLKPGIPLRRHLELSAVTQVLTADGHEPSQGEVDKWVEEHLTDYQKPYFEVISHFADGRTVRVINRCLPNGYTVAMRLDISDATERETLLIEQSEKLGIFKAVLDNVPVANFARDENDSMIYVNEAYCQIVGRPAEELLGTNLEDLFGDDAESYAAANREVADSGEMIEQEQLIENAVGEKIPVVTRLNYVELEEGKRILTGSITDVTKLINREAELKVARERAANTERQLQEIIDSVDFGLVVFDQRDYTIIKANKAINNVWRSPGLGELEGRSFEDVLDYNQANGRYEFNDEEYAAYKADWLECISGSENMPDRYVTVENDQKLLIKGRPIGDGRFLATYNDITELQEREAEFSKAQERLAETGLMMNEALAAMGQGFVLTDTNARILIGNEAAADILRLQPELFEEGKLWVEIIKNCIARGDFTETLEELNDIWRKCRETGKPMEMIACIEGQRWVRFEVKTTPDDLRVIVMTDITSERERQASLEKLVARAETADRAKSEFLANMSHEIRTPMNGILGMAELLAKSELDNKQKTFTDIIVKSGNALLTIINDVLDFSKIDAGQMKLRNSIFDPLEAVEDVATLLSAAAAEKDVELIVKNGPATPRAVNGDAGRFRQIITNLVGNSVKFTEKGHILIEISATESNGRVTLEVVVADTGIGIPEDKLDDIFGKFSQVDGSSTRRHEGTGLGLAITAGLVNLFQGDISVESELGVGTTFKVSLQMDAAQASKPRKQYAARPGSRILVVDDNAVNRTILMEQLGGWGYDACAAEDGSQGIAVLDAAQSMQMPIDLIILDYHMPGMNGVEVARKIRANSWLDKTPIMFLTSMNMAAEEERFADMNVQAHLMKPARSSLLRMTIAELLGEKSGSSAAAQRNNATSQATLAEAASVVASDIDLLIAEDNEVNQIVFTQILEQMRYKFSIVGNGLEAVENWQKSRPPVILMDVSMPVMNGHDATRKIREFEEKMGLPRTPIIGVTAHAQESDKELCLAAGMDDYLSKPISPERLQDKLQRWMPSNRRQKSA